MTSNQKQEDLNNHDLALSNDQLSEVLAAFTAAVDTVAGERSHSETVQKTFCLPGHILELDATGIEAANLLSVAFSHLEGLQAAPEAKKLNWRLADSTGMPEPLIPHIPQLPLSSLGVFHQLREREFFVECQNGLITLFDAVNGRITSICTDLNRIDNPVIARPFLRYFSGLMHKEGYFTTHAALVGRGGRGLLVTGLGGAGKSTISSASVLAGLHFCGDDFIVLSRSNDGFVGHSLYSTIMIDAEHLKNFPDLHKIARFPDPKLGQKAMVPVGPNFPGQSVPWLEIDAVAVPEIIDRPNSGIVQADRARIMRALGPFSIFATPWPNASRGEFFFDVAAELPARAYQSGSIFEEIAHPLLERYGH